MSAGVSGSSRWERKIGAIIAIFGIRELPNVDERSSLYKEAGNMVRILGLLEGKGGHGVNGLEDGLEVD